MAGQQLARDEAGNIWEVDAQGNPVRLHSPAGQTGGPSVVVPAAPKAPEFVPGHPNLVMGNDGSVHPLPGVPAPEPKTSYHQLSPQEIAQRHLNPQHAYQISSDGDVKDLGAMSGGDAEANRKQSSIEATRNLVQSIEKAKKLVSGYSTGIGATIGKLYPGSDQANQLDAIISQEIRGNIFQNWVQTLKAQTDTGTSGIGRIMQSEIPLVTGALGALDPVKLGKQGTLDSLNQIEARVMRSAALVNGENPDDPKVVQKYQHQFLGTAPGAASPPPSAPPQGPGFAPPPTGPTGAAPTPSTDGFNATPDPQSAQFWADAARNQVPYRTALSQWQSDVRSRGLVGQTPPPADAYHRAAEYIHGHPNIPYQPFSSITKTPVGPEAQAATGFFAGSAPGAAIAHAANAAAGTLPTLLAGDQGARFNAVSNALQPTASTLGDIGGTIAGATGVGGMVGNIAPSLGRFGGLIAGSPARSALTGDLLFGGATGAAQNPDAPVLGAALGAGSMAAGNGVGRLVLAPGIKALADSGLGQRAINGARGMFGASPANIPPALDTGQNLIFNRTNGVVGDIRNNLQSAADLGLPYALADANPKLRMLAGSATRKSANVRDLAENVIGPRQLGQGERAIAQINNNLAPVGDVPTMVNEATAQARAASKPLYEQAFSQPAPDLARNPQLAGILERPAAESALRRAYSTALNEGVSPADLSITIGQDGKPLINANPTWKTLHYVRRGLDEEIASAIDPVTGKVMPGMGDSQRAMIGLRSELDNQIGALNPGFKAADAQYAKYASQGSAAQRGAAATGIRVTPEQTQAAVTAAGDNLPHFQRGYASDLADQIERQRMTSNPYNLIYGSMGQRDKIGTVFPQGAENFSRANGLEGDMSKTAYETLGGSPTAARMEADKAFNGPNLGDTAFDLGVSAATGVPPIGLMQRGIRGFAQSARDRFNLGSGAQAKADALGPLLLNPDPNANLIMLNDIINGGAARRAYLSRLNAVSGQAGAGMFGAPLLSLTQQ